MKTIIVAVDKNNAIGARNDLLWDMGTMRDDMANFKRLTTGNTVIMGRRTFESMGSRPLPNRQNIVVSSRPTGVDGVISALSLEAAYALAQYDIFVMGGGQIYAAAIDDMDRLIVSHIDAEFPGADVFFPQIDLSKWHETSREHFDANERNAYAFDVVTYEKV